MRVAKAYPDFQFQYRNAYVENSEWTALQDQQWGEWWLHGSKEASEIKSLEEAKKLMESLKDYHGGHPHHRFRVVDKNGFVVLHDSDLVLT